MMLEYISLLSRNPNSSFVKRESGFFDEALKGWITWAIDLSIESRLQVIKWGFFESLGALEEVIEIINSDARNCPRNTVPKFEGSDLSARAN